MRKFKFIFFLLLFCLSQFQVQAAQKVRPDGVTMAGAFVAGFFASLVKEVLTLKGDQRSLSFVEKHEEVIKSYFEPILRRELNFKFKEANSVLNCQDLYMLMDGRVLAQTQGENLKHQVRRIHGTLQLIFLIEQSYTNQANFCSLALTDREKNKMAQNFIYAFLDEKEKSESAILYKKLKSAPNLEQAWSEFSEAELELLMDSFERILKQCCKRMIEMKLKVNLSVIEEIEDRFSKDELPLELISSGLNLKHDNIDHLMEQSCEVSEE